MAKSKVDQINDAFIDILTKETAKGYESYIKSINRELIDNVDNLTTDKVNEIINKATINLDNVMLLFLIQSTVLLLIDNKTKREAKKDESLAPILILVGMYSLKKPNKFVQKLVKVSKGIGLNAREKEARELIKQFESRNTKILKRANKQAIRNLNKSIRKSKISKRILRDYKQGLRAGKTQASIKNSLVRKYNKITNIERALDTELHAHSEFVRQEHGKAIGYTHKTWKTQQDSKVRDTCFHSKITNKRVPIDSDFRACGMKAQSPGDNRLPPSERIRCRCYNVFD